jgi:hypothetical protein
MRKAATFMIIVATFLKMIEFAWITFGIVRVRAFFTLSAGTTEKKFT